MPTYDRVRYHPPAPVAQVVLRDQTSGKTISDVSLLIDTGADVTLLPAAAAKRLGVQPVQDIEYQLMGFDGTRSSANAVELDLIFVRWTFRGRYLLIDAEHGILGRDVLASVVLKLDGPREEWSE